ncbi:MAG: right-handed parallel beta-helix repeat-containing protein [Clostridia bacterium]|nr:right-handed parallel beta-helix repeat-containing protein [Clostridia bacterium]
MKTKLTCGARSLPVLNEEKICEDIVISSPTTLSGKEISGNVVIEKGAGGTKISDCIICGSVKISANNVSLVRSTVKYTAEGITDSSENGLFLRDCTLEGDGIALSSRANNVEITFCTVKGDIVLGEGENQMIAATKGANIHISCARNTSIVKNEAESISADGCHALYVIENTIFSTLSLTENNFLIADLNKVADIIADENENVNGDTLVDVNARLKVGADKNLLPHLDKDLFVGKPRKNTVRDPEAESEKTLPQYIMSAAKTDEVIFVAPGAYCSDESINFHTAESNTTIYAYGVYAERQKDLYQHMEFYDTENVTVKGLVLAFKQQSCGQVYIVGLEGLDESGNAGCIRVITGAGLMDEFARSDDHYFKNIGWGGAHRDFYAYMDVDYGATTPTEADGTRRVLMSAPKYQRLKVGDVLSCRASNGHGTIQIARSANVTFYDFTMYGNAAAFAWTESNNTTATTYYRVANTTRNGEIIDEATYNKYKEYEKKYGISFEMSIDEEGRFRGSPCHIGSIDATHTMRCGQGSVAICCLFENMCDDGTNQNHTHARLAEIKDNKNGTSTVYYKGMQPMFFYNCRGREKCKEHICDGYCSPFKKGHRVYVYNSGGQLVCDTPALTETKDEGVRVAQEYGTEYKLYSVTVATDAINKKALEGYDLSKNTPEDGPGEKVMVDNMSLASNGFTFDNTVVRNIRSRGLLVKASEGRIENCTFENVGMSCVAILYEIFWGESGVTENMIVKNNLFDHTGFFDNVKYLAPISIHGLGSSVDEDYLLYKNIHIEGNVIRNRTTDHAVYVNSAKGVKIINNDFGNKLAEDIYIEGAVNVEISDNIFSDPTLSRKEIIKAEHIKNIFGSDVTENDTPLFPDKE